ncbi:unnamed protein product [Miscanthus lutarioriparius]|uniref:Uncharacterized protein n=1 Tax=Miscanthus lutarioriparius TaxID=422564 RepID=A0A811RAY6_9POAL|nr:unnamed protein product [Miscanthus lutarioriparius]
MAPSTADLAIQGACDGNLCLLKQISKELELRGVEGFKGRSFLHFAAGGGHVEACKFLVEDSGFHVNSTSAEGETPILVAAEAEGDGNLPVLRYLLDRGGDPAMPDARGFTPLHNAAENGHYEAVRLLLSKGIPVDPLNHRGTPWIVAAAMGQDQVVKILLDHGADPNKVVHYDHSPLTMACCARSLKCVKLLTQAGADVNSKSPHELPVLMIAVNKGLTDTVKFLLEVGADPNIPDMYNETKVSEDLKLVQSPIGY